MITATMKKPWQKVIALLFGMLIGAALLFGCTRHSNGDAFMTSHSEWIQITDANGAVFVTNSYNYSKTEGYIEFDVDGKHHTIFGFFTMTDHQ